MADDLIELMAAARRDFRRSEKEEKEAEKKIAALAEKHPALRVRFAQIVYEKVTLKRWHTTQDILDAMEREVELTAKKSKSPQSN